MNKSDKIIVVTGSTGQQGGAVARRLLANGWRVRALTRDPSKPAAQALAASGAAVVKADNDSRESLATAFKDAYGVFSVQNFWLPNVGVEGEVRQGKRIADASKAAGVRHFVYTSVGGADRNSGVPHFESKWAIEQHIRSLDLPATILRPVAFMENYDRSREQILSGTFRSMGLRPDRTWQIIAVEDIGIFAALAFDNPEKFIGKALEIAGDDLTEQQVADTFSRVTGRPVKVARQQQDNVSVELKKMVAFANNEGYKADIPALRKLHQGLMPLETWLRKSGWDKKN